jgi:hypothetical protein
MALLSRRMEIACDVDLERSLDSFHAYAVPDGIEIGPGDVVIVRGLPNRLAFGESRRFRASATVTRAGTLRKLWTKFSSVFELTGLYEVGFAPAHELTLQPREAA